MRQVGESGHGVRVFVMRCPNMQERVGARMDTHARVISVLLDVKTRGKPEMKWMDETIAGGKREKSIV